MLLVQIITRNKNSSIKNVRDDEFVEFDKASLIVSRPGNISKYYWQDMQDVIIRIYDFNGEVSVGGDNITSTSYGTLNYVSFQLKSEPHRYHFYLSKSTDKESVIDLVKEEIEPILRSSGILKAIYIRETDKLRN
ncbi:hypothetical protein [Fulvivirga sediminis]|uniref:Uncharacterized protein n=1 Tax=Fulvivirga sediminis TaxID=2803949 RepID=A0A937F6W7_9BACT|nr:hypothetical protein [Fulvivirga sediminis]MBL3656131.1 hypothetical protein [Fulvivirga sediminis]